MYNYNVYGYTSVSYLDACMSQPDILIVGGGFSGTMLAVHLLRRSSSLYVAVLDRNSQPGRGLAYGSPYKFHLLNVPACEMSAFPDVPDDFLRWARTHFDAGIRERSFPPRSVYGAYIGDILEKARLEEGPERFQWLHDTALSLHPRGRSFAVQTASGPEILCRIVVLAIGNFPPANPSVPGLDAALRTYCQFPWAPEAVEEIPPAGSVLLLGSGLTSLDFIMALKSKGFRGTIHVLSRKGLFPRARRRVRPVEPWPVFWNEKSPRNVRGLLRLIRSEVHAATERGIDWRAVVDSLRPVTQSIWQSLPTQEQRRFLRHARAFWDVHRHRVAPEIADLLEDMRLERQVCLHIGVLTRFAEHRDCAEITYWDRKSRSERQLSVSRVINCTGSENDCRRIDDSLISSLFAQGIVRPDPLFLGLDADKHGRLINFHGRSSRSLYAIGPPRKGTLWETTTVSEIREQAVDIAKCLVKQLVVRRRVSRILKSAV